MYSFRHRRCREIIDDPPYGIPGTGTFATIYYLEYTSRFHIGCVDGWMWYSLSRLKVMIGSALYMILDTFPLSSKLQRSFPITHPHAVRTRVDEMQMRLCVDL